MAQKNDPLTAARITFRVPKTLIDDIEEEVEDPNTDEENKSELMRNALTEYLADEDNPDTEHPGQ